VCLDVLCPVGLLLARWRPDAPDAQDGHGVRPYRDSVRHTTAQAEDAPVRVDGERRTCRDLLQLIQPGVVLVVAAHEDQWAGRLVEGGGDLGPIVREIVEEAQFGRVMLGVLERRAVEAHEVGERAKVARLQDKVDALAGLALPARAQLEGEQDAAVYVGEDGDVQGALPLALMGRMFYYLEYVVGRMT